MTETVTMTATGTDITRKLWSLNIIGMATEIMTESNANKILNKCKRPGANARGLVVRMVH
jgi:hypothetical protein